MNWAVTEWTFFALYLLLGPAIWVLFCLAMVSGRVRMSLFRPTRLRAQSPPRATILIPAKDEGQRIADCLNSALAQDYPDFSVLAIDDRSSDCTGQVMDQLALGNPRLRVVHIPHGNPPVGWTGKCNALNTAVKQAEGEWLLFVDSDVILQPAALSETIRVAAARDYDLLSLLPRLECHSLWESLLVPLAGVALSMLHLVALTNVNSRSTAFANGQFILIRRRAYDAIGGHEAVRDQFCEDIEMARVVKGRGLQVRVSWGAHLAAVRMYSSLASIFRGWARIFFAGSLGRPWRILLGMLFVLLCGYSVYLAAGLGLYRWFSPGAVPAGRWLMAAGVHAVLMTGALAVSYSWTGNPRRNALLLPLSAAMLLGIFARALWMCFSGNVEWRGTRYSRATANMSQGSGK